MLGLISLSLGDQVVTSKPAGLGVCNLRGEGGAEPVGRDAAECPVSTQWTARWPCAGCLEPSARSGQALLPSGCEEGTRGKRGTLESGPRTQQRTQRTAERASSLGPRAAAARGTGARWRGQGRGSSVRLSGPRPLMPNGLICPQARRLPRCGKDGSRPGQERVPCQQGGSQPHSR